MSLPSIMAGMPKEVEASVESRVPIPADTSATPGTLFTWGSLLMESGWVEKTEAELAAATVTLPE